MTGDLEDNDGLGDLNYQWQRSGDGEDWNMIIGAGEDRYTLDDNDVGQQVRAVISYTDGQGTYESVASSVSDVINNVNDAPEGSVVITGTLSQGQTLFADTHGPKDADGIGTFSYQWQRTEDGNHFVDIPAANSETYLLTDEDAEMRVRVQVSYTDQQGTRESFPSEVTTPIANINDVAQGDIVLSGTAMEDRILSVDTSQLSDLDGLGDLNYFWQLSSDGDVWRDRDNSRESTVILSDGDVGLYIRAGVSYHDGYGYFETVYSSLSGPVLAVNDPMTGNIEIDGLLASGQTLSVDVSAVDDIDGLGDFVFSWYRADDPSAAWTLIETSS